MVNQRQAKRRTILYSKERSRLKGNLAFDFMTRREKGNLAFGLVTPVTYLIETDSIAFDLLTPVTCLIKNGPMNDQLVQV